MSYVVFKTCQYPEQSDPLGRAKQVKFSSQWDQEHQKSVMSMSSGISSFCKCDNQRSETFLLPVTARLLSRPLLESYILADPPPCCLHLVGFCAVVTDSTAVLGDEDVLLPVQKLQVQLYLCMIETKAYATCARTHFFVTLLNALSRKLAVHDVPVVRKTVWLSLIVVECKFTIT